MTPQQVDRAEHVVWLAAFLAIVLAVAAFDWRLGLLVAGLLLWVSVVDIPWRRP